MTASKMYSLVAVVFVATVAGSWALHQHLRRPDPYDPRNQPIPIKETVQSDLAGTGTDGKPASFIEASRGKVTVCAYLWTACPEGCANVFLTMRELRDFFAGRKDLQFINVAVLPDLDPPEKLREFAVSQGVKPEDPWLMLSGFPRETAWDFMHQQLGFNPTPPPTFKEDSPECCRRCEHDLRIVLIDRQARVRGHYQVNDPVEETRAFFRAKLFGDTGRLLDGGD